MIWTVWFVGCIVGVDESAAEAWRVCSNGAGADLTSTSSDR